MKKLLSVVLTCIFLLSTVTVVSFAKTSEEADTHLQFGADGKFKILQIADIQDDNLMKITENFIVSLLETENPDLVVLSGDNINASASKSLRKATSAIDKFMRIFEAAGVPVAAVFGNHDSEYKATRAEQMKIYESYSCFIGCAGVDFGDYTCGTYYVPIYASDDADNMVYNLWMIDSGDYDREMDTEGYACVTKAQIEWYKETEKALAAQNGGTVPSMVFQHIVVPEIYDALVETDADSSNIERNGKYYQLPDGAKGGLYEAPCPPAYSNGQLDALKSEGDVKAIFFGHDHYNTYEVSYMDIMLCNTPGIGFSSYNSSKNGVRVITLDENNLDTFETQVIYYLDYFADDSVALILYDIYSDESSVFTKIIGVFRYITAVIGNAVGCV